MGRTEELAELRAAITALQEELQALKENAEVACIVALEEAGLSPSEIVQVFRRAEELANG